MYIELSNLQKNKKVWIIKKAYIKYIYIYGQIYYFKMCCKSVWNISLDVNETLVINHFSANFDF